MSVLERFQRDEFGQLAAKDFGMSSQVMDQHLRCLLVLGEISTLIEAARHRRVHEEVRRSVELDHQASRSRWIGVCIRAWFSGFECDVLDEGKWKFDLVTSRIVVDIVSDAGFVRGVEDDKIHRVLSNSTP